MRAALLSQHGTAHLALALVLLGCTPSETPVATPAEPVALPSALPPAEPPPAPPPVSVLTSGVKVETLRAGHGALASKNRTLLVEYTGMFPDGKVFDSTGGRGPFSFILQSGQVIKGWDQGIEGMRVGEVRRLTIPPDLAYGERGRPPTIPAAATLIFEVELVGVR